MIKLGSILEYHDAWNRSDLPDCTINVRLADKEKFESSTKYGIDIGEPGIVTEYDPTTSSMDIIVNPDITVGELCSFIKDCTLEALRSHIEQYHE